MLKTLRVVHVIKLYRTRGWGAKNCIELKIHVHVSLHVSLHLTNTWVHESQWIGDLKKEKRTEHHFPYHVSHWIEHLCATETQGESACSWPHSTHSDSAGLQWRTESCDFSATASYLSMRMRTLVIPTQIFNNRSPPEPCGEFRWNGWKPSSPWNTLDKTKTHVSLGQGRTRTNI